MMTNQDVNEGMKVYSRDGESLGKVTRCLESSFEIEKGFFFPKEYLARYDDVAEIRDNGIYLRASKEELNLLGASPSGTAYAAGSMGADTGGNLKEETRIPLAEEELEASKTQREHEVHVSKHVVTETQQFNIPVSREEVTVERVAADRPATPEEATFREENVTIPVVEEEVHVEKRPVVREELRLSKDMKVEEQKVTGEVRKERADIAGREVKRRQGGEDLGTTKGNR